MQNQFTEGKILKPLLEFALPVLLALCLQSLYGAVDLLVVGQFGQAADVSAVSTGSQMMQMVTTIVSSLAMGTTVLLGQAIGSKRIKEASDIMASSIALFAGIAIISMGIMLVFTKGFATILHSPTEAFNQTVGYVRICSLGMPFIVAYNVIGSIFRGIGDSKTPLKTVAIACVVNIIADLVFVAGFKMHAYGAALATVLAQGVSVVLSLWIIKRQGLPFQLGNVHQKYVFKVLQLGFPIALQESLVSVSFLTIASIVNSLGVIVSAGVGVAEKICAFIMLVPSVFSQSLSAFVSQNMGANQPKRARKAMYYGMAASFIVDLVMAYLAFFQGDLLSSIFASDTNVIYASSQYLKAYAIDTLLVSFLFCFIGYMNGQEKTTFVMVQGIIGAFCVRIPVSYFMRHLTPVSIFKIGLATPCSTIVQILLFIAYDFYLRKKSV